MYSNEYEEYLKFKYSEFMKTKNEQNDQLTWSMKNFREKLEKDKQEKAEKIKRIKGRWSFLTVEEVIMKWASYYVGQCELWLHFYYTDKANKFLCDEILSEQNMIEKFLLDMMFENVENMKDIIATIYGENSQEFFIYNLLLRTREFDLKKHEKE